jgi:Mannose-6-phosphate isomerase
MLLQPGFEVGEHTHHGNYEVYYVLSGLRHVPAATVRRRPWTAGTVTFTGDGESHVLRNDGDTPLEFLALVLNLPAQA